MPGTGQMSLETCKLVCGPSATLWPLPSSVSLSKDTIPFLPRHLTHTNLQCTGKVCDLLDEAVRLMNETLCMYHPLYEKNSSSLWTGPYKKNVEDHSVFLQLSVHSPDVDLKMFMDESYHFVLDTDGKTTFVFITATTFFGARHALETFSQLVDFDPVHDSLQVIDDFFTF